MVFATSALHCASSLTSNIMLSVELRPCLAAISAASAEPSTMSAIITCGAFGRERLANSAGRCPPRRR